MQFDAKYMFDKFFDDLNFYIDDICSNDAI